MDNNISEKKLSPENSNSFKTSTDSSSNPNHDLDPDPADTGTSNNLSYESPNTEVKSQDSDNTANKIEGVDQQSQSDNVDRIEEAPPEIHYTLESLSVEIDQFVSSFPERKATNIPEESKNYDFKDENEDNYKIPEFVDKFLDLIKEKIAVYESNDGKGKSSSSQVADDDNCSSSFLEAVNRVSQLTVTLSEFKSDPNLSKLINRIGGIHQQAMSYLEDEFRMLMEDYRSNDQENNDKNAQDEESSESMKKDQFLGYGDETIEKMRRIAKEMIEGGYESECCQVYMITRRNAFDEYLERDGFEKISIDEVQKMQWEALEREIPAWINTFKDCATVYFSKERQLAEAIYSDKPDISSSLFSNLVRGVMIQLLNFTEGIAMTNRSAEKLFKFLDMYETLRDSIPAMDGLLPEECENELKTEMTTAKCRIGEAAISLFCDLENSIKSDTGKTTVPGGAVHPLARYTMNYLKYACEYMTTLEQVFRQHSKIERADSTSRSNYQAETPEDSSNNKNQDDNHSPFSAQLMRVMDLLDSNLEAKAKLYRETALSNIFMMNNGRYILQKIKGSSEIHQVVGDNWCRKKSSDLRNFHKNYQRETWSKVLGCLGHEGLQVNGKVQKPVLKERFKSFNLMFDEIHRTQSTWVVSDEQLQSELRVSISAVVIPAYRSFLGRFSQYLDPGRQYEKYIKYQPEDIETCIDEIFDGNATAMPRKRP